jgi:ligand-binding SRPBCC domain-containing protein/NAD dependent epimerase/dehydratase family enzyme
MPDFNRVTDFSPASTESLFEWHESPQAFQRLTPPWEAIHVEKYPEGLSHEATAWIRVYLLGRFTFFFPWLKCLSLQWIAVHDGYLPPHQFIDTQSRGPFAAWQHRHEFTGSTLRDAIHYALPFEPIASFLCKAFVEAKLRRLFRFRHRVLGYDLSRNATNTLRGKRILIMGNDEMIQAALMAFLLGLGVELRVLLCRPPKNPEAWRGVDYHVFQDNQAISPQLFEGIYGVLQFPREQNPKQNSKQDIQWHTDLVNACLASTALPQVWISISDIAQASFVIEKILGTSDEATHLEPKTLAEQKINEWEESLKPLEEKGIRLCHARLGMVMDEAGGYMKKFSLLFSCFGVYMPRCKHEPFPWISLEDVLGGLLHLLQTPTNQGVFHLFTPEEVTVCAFNQAWAQAMGMPFWGGNTFSTPKDFREETEAPKHLLDESFQFLHPNLKSLFSHTVDIQGMHEWWVSKI